MTRSGNLLLSMLALAAGAAGPSALAHEGGAHAKGTVKEITADRIVVATPAGAEVRIALLPGTQVVRGHRGIPASEVRVGERVVVHAATHDGKLEATEVMVAEPAK